MLLELAPAQTLVAELNVDGHFKELLLNAAASLMATILGNSVYKIQENWNPQC